jgi:fatty acid desaturase
MKFDSDSSVVVIVLIVLVAVAVVAVGPLLILWSLNTLFPALAIPYTVWTWLATVLLGSVLSPAVRVTKRN